MKRFFDFLFFAILIAASIYAAYHYGSQLYIYGIADGMRLLLWACDDAIRVVANDWFKTTDISDSIAYAGANIVLFFFIEPFLILLASLGCFNKKEMVRKVISWAILLIGVAILVYLTELYIDCRILRFGN